MVSAAEGEAISAEEVAAEALTAAVATTKRATVATAEGLSKIVEVLSQIRIFSEMAPLRARG